MYISGSGLKSILHDIDRPLVGAEVGVSKALTTSFLLKECGNIRTIYAIDPWMAYTDNVGSMKGYTKEEAENRYNVALQNLEPYKGRYTIIRKTSEQAAKDIDDGSLDFVFIDGNHSYEFVRDDLELWYPKVKVGGHFSGHDANSAGVAKALSEFNSTRNKVVKYLENSVWYLVK